jgi:hypothetical protein
MLWVGQANKWKAMLLPVIHKGCCIFRPDHYDLGILHQKLFVIAAQLRHVLLAERSEEAAVEDQKNILVVFEIREADLISFEIRQREVWGWGVDFDAFVHN